MPAPQLFQGSSRYRVVAGWEMRERELTIVSSPRRAQNG
jgi:hypothetical protein